MATVRNFTNHYAIYESDGGSSTLQATIHAIPDGETRIHLETRWYPSSWSNEGQHCGIGMTLDELREFIGAVEQEARRARQQNCH